MLNERDKGSKQEVIIYIDSVFVNYIELDICCRCVYDL